MVYEKAVAKDQVVGRLDRQPRLQPARSARKASNNHQGPLKNLSFFKGGAIRSVSFLISFQKRINLQLQELKKSMCFALLNNAKKNIDNFKGPLSLPCQFKNKRKQLLWGVVIQWL